MRHTLSCIQLAHRRDFQFAGILLSGHLHCSPPFNVNCPLISCLTFGVQSSLTCPSLSKQRFFPYLSALADVSALYHTCRLFSNARTPTTNQGLRRAARTQSNRTLDGL